MLSQYGFGFDEKDGSGYYSTSFGALGLGTYANPLYLLSAGWVGVPEGIIGNTGEWSHTWGSFTNDVAAFDLGANVFGYVWPSRWDNGVYGFSLRE